MNKIFRLVTVTLFVSCLLPPLSAKENNFDLLLTAEPWLLPIVAPLSARLQKKQPPLLAIIPANYPEREVALTSRITNTLLLATKNQMARLSPQAARQTITLPNHKTQASLQIAQQFWPSSHQVIGAWVDDSESIIMGATLAAHSGVPFLYFSDDLPAREWRKQLSALKVKQITLINKRRTPKLRWLDKYYQVSRLRPAQITPLLVQQLGQNLENILLARVPKPNSKIGENTWLVPYISLLRKSLPLLLTTNDPSRIENKVTQLIQRYTLKPSTITLLGDSSAIGMYDYHIESVYADGDSYSYNFPVEIFTSPQDEYQALSFGIGRIPFNQLYQTATLFVRGLYRERLFQEQQHRILMIANPLDSYQDEGLPLCETISRATSQELRNFSLKVNEFYRRTPDDQAMMDASKNADLIIFQGHAYHQRLLDDPEFFFQLEMADEMGQAESESPFRANHLLTSLHSFFADMLPAKTEVAELNPKRFNNLPIVILQSCNSLENYISDWLLQLGGVALIGSVSNIHSASGSSFIKTLIDRALYEGETLGTALREARNYFFVLQDLKNQRGHREQVKSLRVALSFRLWGDPQLKMFKPLPAPRKQPLSIVWENPHTLTITTPSKRLPKIETEKYIAYGYPGVQYAGIVKRLKKKSARKLIPLYFVKTPLPAQVEQYQFMTVLKGKTDRVAYRIDPENRQLYLLYLTEKEKKYPSLRFQFYED
jgi:hypothetical protein